MITYKKKNNDLVQHIVDSFYHDIGYVNSYGWTVVDIQVYYEGRFYSVTEYEVLFNERCRKLELKRKRKQDFKNILSKPILFIDKRLNNLVTFIDKL